MKVLIIIIALVELGCAGAVLNKRNFNANPSRLVSEKIDNSIDGIYGSQLEFDGGNKWIFFSLYQNGVAISNYFNEDSLIIDRGGTLNISKVYDKLIKIDKLYKGRKQAGGVRVHGGQISIEIFEFAHYGNYELTVYQGSFINDSTIFISTCESKAPGRFCPENFKLRLYRTVKPDSSNQLMKKNWYWSKENSD